MILYNLSDFLRVMRTCLYLKDAWDGSPLFLILYVNNMLLFGRNVELADLIRQLWLKFATKDLGPARHILRMKITWHRAKKHLFLSHDNYIRQILERFNVPSARSASTPLLANLRLSQKDCSTSGLDCPTKAEYVVASDAAKKHFGSVD